MTFHLRRARFALLFSGVTLASIGQADAAVIFGSTYGGLTVYSRSTAQAKAPSSTATTASNMADPETSATFVSSLTAVSTAQSTDGGYSASATNTTTATFANAGSGVVTFVGNSAATAPQTGLAQANNNEYFSYYFTLTSSESIVFNISYSSTTLGCCGNSASLTNSVSGQSIFNHNNYNSDNSFSYTGTLAAGQYALFVGKGEYFGYDAASFNGTSGAKTVLHNDRISFTIGNQATGAVPEPASWAMMIAGFGLIGGAIRRRRGALLFA